MFKPWIGQQYEATRLLLLGESAYSWEKNGKVIHPNANHSIDLVQLAIRSFDHDCPGFIRTLSRAIVGEQDPSPRGLEFAWNRVAFNNYVQRTVGLGPRVRPTDEMWKEAKIAFSRTLADLNPARIVVLGIKMWSKMRDSNLHIADNFQGYRLSSGEICYCWAVNHPSRGLSWQALASIVQFACGNELRQS